MMMMMMMMILRTHSLALISPFFRKKIGQRLEKTETSLNEKGT